jgi:hypothetical protein
MILQPVIRHSDLKKNDLYGQLTDYMLVICIILGLTINNILYI